MAERLVAAEKLRDKIAEEATIRKAEESKKFYGNQHTNVDCRPIGQESKISDIDNNQKMHTRKELAKIAGVGTGTVSRYEKVYPI